MILVHVVKNHPLSRFYCFPKRQIFGANVTSIEMAFCYIQLYQQGKGNLAVKMSEDSKNQWEPELIINWLKSHNVKPDVKWVQNSYKVYWDITCFLLETQGNPFYDEFISICRSTDHPSDLQFLVASHSNELVWSTGFTSKMLQTENPHPGFNLYGEILDRFARRYRDGRINLSYFWASRGLLSSGNAFPGSRYRKGLLLLSDSHCKYAHQIPCSQVVSISGGNYTHIKNAINRLRINLSEFSMIIVNVGCNALQFQSEDRAKETFLELAEVLAQEARNRDQEDRSILFSPAWPHPSVTEFGIEPHALFIENYFFNKGVGVVDWVNYYQNAFFYEDGGLRSELFEGDGFHLGHKGFTILWGVFCAHLPDLELFPYHLSTTSLAMSKWNFTDQDPPNSCPVSSKRRRRN